MGADATIDAGGASAEAPPDVSGLERCIRHLIHHDLTRGETGSGHWEEAARALVAPAAAGVATRSSALGEDGIGLDSLARLSAASAVSRFFDLGTTGLDDYLLAERTTGGWAGLVARHLALSGNDARIVFETSGSTDRPSLVPKRLAELDTEIAAFAEAVLPARPRRIVALAPPRHIFGFLMTVRLPVHLGVPVLDAVHRGAGSTRRRLMDGDLVIGTPFHWAMLLSAGGSFPPGVSGITSAGAMPRKLRAGLDAAGLADLTEIFGSTETGGLGWRRSADAPFAILPHLERRGNGLRFRNGGATVPLQDRLTWHDMRHFTPAGRIDRAIQIAGVNVSLALVRSVLCDSALVADAAVRPSGERLKAFIVPADPEAPRRALIAGLNAHVRGLLEPVARPVGYTFGPALPVNDMGKPADW